MSVSAGNRQSNFELLRIAAMIMIVAHHLSVHGALSLGVWQSSHLLNKVTLALFMPGGEVGVAIFFMISGYFLCGRKSASVRRIWCQTEFYGILAVVIYIISLIAGFRYQWMGGGGQLSGVLELLLLPQLSGVWWFVSAYILLAAALPLIHDFLDGLDERQMTVLLILFFLFCYALFEFVHAPYVSLAVAFMYFMVGYYIKKYVTGHIRATLSAVSGIVAWLFYSAGIFIIKSFSGGIAHLINFFWTYINTFFIFAAAVSFFLLFRELKVHSLTVNRTASAVFGVYLFHDSLFTRPLLWRGVFRISSVYCSALFPLYAAAVVIIVFATGLAVDFIYQRFFESVFETGFDSAMDFFRTKVRSQSD